MNNYYVYVYKNPMKDDIPFYIGKGKNKRAYDHLNESFEKTENRRKWFTINKILKNGYEPIIEFIQTDLNEDDAYNLEDQLIEKYGRAGYDIGGILTNICKDARPPSPKGKVKSLTHRQNLSKSHTGKTISKETRRKFSINAKKRIDEGTFGHYTPHSNESKELISIAKTGVKQTDESNEKRSEALKDKPWSEARRNASINGKKTGPKKGKPWSEARRLAHQLKQEERKK